MTSKVLFGMRSARRLVWVAAMLAPACSSASSPGATADAGAIESEIGSPDSGDAGVADGGSDLGADFGTVDAGPETGGDGGADAGGCVYPSGPYGVEPGDVIDPTTQWQAYAPNSTVASTLKITDLYDCDGSKGINAIVFDTSAQWCVACQYEANNVPQWMSSTGINANKFSALGVQFVTLLIQNNAYEPATLEVATQWRAQFAETMIYVGVDPAITFTNEGLPHNLLVDPRTMVITTDIDNDTYDDSVPGDDAATAMAPDPAIAKLATKNAK